MILVRQRGLAASRGARVILKEIPADAAQDFIKAPDPGRQFVDFHFSLLCSSFPSFSETRPLKAASGHTS